MTKALVTTYPGTGFTPDPELTYEYLLPATGLPSDPVAWFDADMLTAADGTKITSWPSLISSHTLVVDGEDGPTLRTLDNHRYLEFDGVNDALRIATLTGVSTIAILSKGATGANSGAINFGPGYWNGKADGTFTIIGGGSDQTGITATPTAQKWSWRFLSTDGTTRRFSVNGGAYTTAAITTTINRLEIAKRYSAGIYGPLYVSKVLLFPDVITTTEGASAASTLATERPTWVA